MIAPEKYTTSDGYDSWRVAWRVGGRGGRKQSATFSTRQHTGKGEAEKYAKRAAQLVEAHQRRITREQVYAEILGIEEAVPTGPKLAEWYAEWVADKVDVERSTLAEYRRIWRTTLAEPFGQLALEEITTDLLSKWAAELTRIPSPATGKPLSSTSIHRYHALIHLLLKDAVRAGKLTANAAEHTTLPKAEHTERVFLTEPEAALLLAAISDPMARHIIEVLLGTGLRWSELTALQGRDITVIGDKATLRIERAWKHAGAKWYLGEPKSKRSRRTISVSPKVLTILQRYAKPKKPMALLFANSEGKMLHHSNWQRRHWRPAVALARGLAVDADRKPIPPPGGAVLTKQPVVHSMRHTHAAWLLSSGKVTLTRLSWRLGHENEATTDRFYGHFVPKDDGDMHDVLDSALFG